MIAAVELINQGTNTGGNEFCWLADIHRQSDEFIASDPGYNIVLAECGLEYLGGRHNREIACFMAMGIVDLLQTIQIDKEQQAGESVAAGVAQQLLCQQEKATAVVQSSQLVGQ